MPTSNPLISVVVASYNYEQYIAQTLESVLNQTYTNFEVIVVDDGSKDNSVEIVKKYSEQDCRVKLYQHEKGINKGLAETIKLALSKANGEFIAFCESDDWWSENLLEEKVKIINKHKNVGFISNKIEIINLGMQKENECAIYNYISYTNKLLKKKSGKNIFEYMLIGNMIPTFSAVMVKKELLMACDFSPVFDAWLDYWLWCQILINSKIYFFDKCLTYWRKHKESYLATDKTKLDLKAKHQAEMFEYIANKYPKEYRVAKFNLLFKHFIGTITDCNLGIKTFYFLFLPVFKIKINAEYKYFYICNIRICKIKMK